jgi:hypothetical protein
MLAASTAGSLSRPAVSGALPDSVGDADMYHHAEHEHACVQQQSQVSQRWAAAQERELNAELSDDEFGDSEFTDDASSGHQCASGDREDCFDADASRTASIVDDERGDDEIEDEDEGPFDIVEEIKVWHDRSAGMQGDSTNSYVRRSAPRAALSSNDAASCVL